MRGAIDLCNHDHAVDFGNDSSIWSIGIDPKENTFFPNLNMGIQ